MSPFGPRATMNAGPTPPLRLEAGRGFQTRSVRYQVDDFIIVDASMPPGLCAPLHVHERAYVTLMLRGGFDEQYGARALSIRAGTMNFVPAGVPHRTHSHGAGLVRMEFPDAALAGAEELGSMLRQPEAMAGFRLGFAGAPRGRRGPLRRAWVAASRSRAPAGVARPDRSGECRVTRRQRPALAAGREGEARFGFQRTSFSHRAREHCACAPRAPCAPFPAALMGAPSESTSADDSS